jgi:LPXTG-motif cell wall-anchored protein
MVKRFLLPLVVFFFIPFLFSKVHAVTYDLVAPEGPLRRGNEAQFTIYIDTEDSTVTTGEIGMTYDTAVLEYVSTSPGSAMSSVSKTDTATGKFLLTGTSVGFKGNDVFAYVTFKIIADKPGSTEICALWAPTASPSSTPAPTSPPGTPNPTNPLPTALPKTGTTEKGNSIGLIGGLLFMAGASFILLKQVLL